MDQHAEMEAKLNAIMAKLGTPNTLPLSGWLGLTNCPKRSHN
jgi:hypothetical protein